MRIFTYVFLFIIILFGLTFACLNANSVAINYYVGTSHMPLSLLVVIALAVGGVMGLCIGLFLLLQVKHENRRLQRRAKIAEKEIENIRALPLQENR